jgi:alcohol dehydrogenase
LYAIELISKYLGRAVRKGQDLEARGGMMLGSLLAGISFGNSGVAGVHCMAEALGGMFDVPHGVANAIFLPYMMGYNLPSAPERTARIGYTMGVNHGGFSNVQKESRLAVLAVYDLVQKLKIPTLKGTGISSEDLDSLAGQAYQNSSTPDNTRKIGEADYLALFRKAFDEEDPL